MSLPNDNDDAELERLLAEAAADPTDREGLREAHRQLEKDLLRLADPLPPSDFVSKVMARVEAEPKRVSASDFGVAVAIATVALIGASAAFVSSGGSASHLGLSIAQAFVAARELAVGIASGLAAAWRTAGLPLTVVLSGVAFVSLLGMRRLVNAKVVS